MDGDGVLGASSLGSSVIFATVFLTLRVWIVLLLGFFSVVSSCCFSIRSNGSCVSWVHLMLALPTEAWWPRWYEGCPLSWAGILGHMDMFGGFLQDGAPVRERM